MFTNGKRNILQTWSSVPSLTVSNLKRFDERVINVGFLQNVDEISISSD